MDLKQYLTCVKNRCKNNGMHPDDPFIVNRFVTEDGLKEKQEQYSLLLYTVNGILDKILDFIQDHPVLLAITDDVPVILEVMGDPEFVARAKDVGLQPGAILQESFVGTSAPLAALELQIPVSLIGADHYFTILHEFVCYSVPIRNKRKDII